MRSGQASLGQAWPGVGQLRQGLAARPASLFKETKQQSADLYSKVFVSATFGFGLKLVSILDSYQHLPASPNHSSSRRRMSESARSRELMPPPPAKKKRSTSPTPSLLSLGATSVGAGSLFDDDEPPDRPDIADLHEVTDDETQMLCEEAGPPAILSIKTCRTCLHSTNERNPCRGILNLWYYWPWAAGTRSQPTGRQCRLCPIAFKLGGFKSEYSTLEAMSKDMAKGINKTLPDEFASCLNKAIAFINEGKLTMRVHKGKKEAFMEDRG